MALGIKTFSITALSIKVLFVTLSINYDQRENRLECHYAECRNSFIVMLNVIMLKGVMLKDVILKDMRFVIMLKAVMLSVLMLSVITLNVVAHDIQIH
jgi:hypothetical protein